MRLRGELEDPSFTSLGQQVPDPQVVEPNRPTGPGRATGGERMSSPGAVRSGDTEAEIRGVGHPAATKTAASWRKAVRSTPRPVRAR